MVTLVLLAISIHDSNNNNVEAETINTTDIRPDVISLGAFKLTAYCPCEQCCGKSDGITASGEQAVEGVTIAVDPDIIPLGSVIVINGHQYIAQDTGSAIKGNKIDIYFDSHQDALDFGVQYQEVYRDERI